MIPTIDISLTNQIFVNRTLNMKTIKLIGFDMDYTLVLYNEVEVETLAFKGAKESLIRNFGYNTADLAFSFEPELTMRGLVIDKKLGNILKINQFGYIKSALHGNTKLSVDEQKKMYANQIVTFSDQRYEVAHTMFSLASISLYANLVERIKDKPYEDLYDDIVKALDELHRNGYIKNQITSSPQKFVFKDEKRVKTLEMLKKFGKKLVLITNSEWHFTQAMMTYAYQCYLPAGTSWQSLFDLIIVEAGKPVFFKSFQKFFEVTPANGYLKNVTSDILTERIYQGGNAAQVEALFQVKSSEILYVGDHIYSDIYQSKKTNLWRTMLVISELGAELERTRTGLKELSNINQLMEEKSQAELFLDQMYKLIICGTTYGCPTTEDLDSASPEQAIESTKATLQQIDQKLRQHLTSYNRRFNPNWGELMWAGNDKSKFASSIERHACLFSSDIANLLNYSAFHYFRPTRSLPNANSATTNLITP